jgi:hypothetical protein
MALMLKLAVLMHVSFLRRAMHICRADCDKRTAVLALSPPPPCRKAFQMHGARCSRIEGSGDGDGSYARARPSRSSGRSYRTSEFSRQVLLFFFFFLKRSLQASCRLQQGSSGSRFPSTRTLTTSC